MLTDLYWEQKVVVRIEDDRNGWTEIQRGAKQGCVLSPNHISLYSQVVMDKLKDVERIKVVGRNINISGMRTIQF